MMTNRDVWVKAGTIPAEHGELTTDYITDALGDWVAVDDWCRVAAACDKITGVRPQ